MQSEQIPSLTTIRQFQQFAEHIVDQTRALILDLWLQNDIGARLKEDRTPVTEVDLKAEQLARELLREKYPEHGVIGEEFEPLNPESDFQWTVDPIDGTQNLVNRIPTFGTLIGLRFKNKAIVGVIDHPALDVRCSGGSGLGVTCNGSAVAIQDLAQDSFTDNDIIVTNNIGVFGRDTGGAELFHRIMEIHPHSRVYYDCYGHTLAITGSVAVVVEPNLKIWDVTPAEALITEAGGEFRYFNVQKDIGPSTLYNAVFGKPKAVEILDRHMQGWAQVTGR